MKRMTVCLILATCVVVTLGLGSRSAEAQLNCYTSRACTVSSPCGWIIRGDTYEEDVPISVTCGRECRLADSSGADGCQTTYDRITSCLRATIIGPGCCSVPCQPPAVGCEPNGGGEDPS